MIDINREIGIKLHIVKEKIMLSQAHKFYLIGTTGAGLTDGEKLWPGPEILKKSGLLTSVLKNVSRPSLAQLTPLALQTLHTIADNVSIEWASCNLESLEPCALWKPKHYKLSTKRSKKKTVLNLKPSELTSLPKDITITSRITYKICILHGILTMIMHTAL